MEPKIQQHDANADTVIRRPQLKAATGLGSTRIYEMVRAGEFPQPIQLSGRAIGWLKSEVDEWLKKRPRVQFGTRP